MIYRLLMKALWVLGISLVFAVTLYATNGSQWLHQFDNRVVADKSPPQKTEHPIFGNGFELTQAIDLSWANVSDPRLLSQPFCLGLMLSPGSAGSQDANTYLKVALESDEHQWVWETPTKKISGGYTRYCSIDAPFLEALVKAKEAQIRITSIGGKSTDNLANVLLAPATETAPAFANGKVLDSHHLAFKIDAHPSPTIVDLFKYAVLLLLASSMTFVMGQAAYRDWLAQRAEKSPPPTSH